MKLFLTVAIVLAMLAVVIVLGAGLLGMARGDQAPARANRLMQWRIILQGAALALMATLLMIWRH